MLPASVFGADEPTSDKTTIAQRASSPPVIDGLLDDAVWVDADLLDDFHEIQPQEYAAARETTEVRILFDSDALYIGVRAFDAEPEKITAKVLRQSFSLRHEDRIKLILSPFNDKRSGFAFFINPNGVRVEGIYKEDDIDGNWNGIWQAASTIDDEGWSAEIAIPFKSLSFVEGQDWGFNVSRAIAREQVELGWVSRNRQTNASIVGTLTGLNGLSQGVGLDIVPSVSATNRRDFDAGSNESNFEPSLDLFYRITPSLNTSLTINTDFSATEVDNRQVNLTRFNLFFPEKRDFFLRESDIFEFGGINSDDRNETFSRADSENGRPYFSRRIGLSSTGQPVDLDVGAKISGRIGRWNVGAQVLRQAEFESVDATDILVSRISANILEESTAGFIITDGDPRTNLDNTLIGFDFLYRNTRLAYGRSLNANVWYQQTDTEGLDGDDAAYGFEVSAPNQTGWKGGAAFKEIQQNFNPAVGFISRPGIRQYSGDVGYTYRPYGKWFRSLQSGIDAQRIDLLDGDLQSQAILFSPVEIRNNSNDEFSIAYRMDKENLLAPFEISDGVIIPLGDYAFDSTEIEVKTSPHRVADFKFEYEFGDFFDGDIETIETEFGWRPSKHFRTSIAYTVSDVALPQGDFTTRLARASFDIVFSNTLSWVNLIQYDNVSESIGLNSRLHWAPQSGRNVFLVLNHNYQERLSDMDFHSVSTDLTLKADYTFRF
ncbi:MAG: DUF5916 domain-containing protein [Woeseiaceae bacterium]